MASAFSHAVVAWAIGTFQPSWVRTPKFWVLSVACAIVPDVDVIGFVVGIDYGDMFGHRGITHSLLFATMFAGMVVRLGFPEHVPPSPGWCGLFLHFSLVTASHGLLDAMTDGGLGVAFFAPFIETRYFFPWRPVQVSPIGITPFFTMTGLFVLISEAIFIWLPAALLVKGAKWIGGWRASKIRPRIDVAN